MANTLNTLYPPQMSNTFMPAFVFNTGARVYYSISPFNSIGEIMGVHYSVVEQATNMNALIEPSGVVVEAFKDLEGKTKFDKERQMYYIDIPTSFIKGGAFKIDSFYKVQIRFDSMSKNVPAGMTTSQYLIENQDAFSEWSSVCLIRPIYSPKVILKKFDQNTTGDVRAFNKGIIPISGKVYFYGPDDSGKPTKLVTDSKEILQSFSIDAYNDRGDVVYSTGEVYTGANQSPNEINSRIDMTSVDTTKSSDFSFTVRCTTKNQYTFESSYEFQIGEYTEDASFKPMLTVTTNDDDGTVTLHVVNNISCVGTLYVKRASSYSDFTIWEDFKVVKVDGKINLFLTDNTVCSMAWYKYAVQLENPAGGTTEMFKTEKILPDFYDATFSRLDRQISIRYNFKISAFKPVVSRNKVDTLGGRYPKFVENGTLNYKQFSINGLISSQEDYNSKFLKKQEYFSSNYRNYQSYIAINDIDEYSDYLWEREFREEVVKWLNDGEPKLFRSLTEGVMCVMVSDVSLTPNSVLGRRLWEISATVTEIADGSSLDTLESLGIFDSGKSMLLDNGSGDDPGAGGLVTSTEVFRIGQESQYIVADTFTDPVNQDIVNNYIYGELVKRYSGILASRRIKSGDITLKDLRIQFLNKPHLYIFSGDNSIVQIQDERNLGQFSGIDERKIRRGYRIVLNGSDIFINENGYYQSPSCINVESLILTDERDIVALDYIVTYIEENDYSDLSNATVKLKTIIGQQSGKFDPDHFVGEEIKSKYSYLHKEEIGEGEHKEVQNVYSLKMLRWRGIRLDVTPYAVFSLEYKTDDLPIDYCVGESGVYNILDGFRCNDMCFRGKRMFRRNSDRQKYLLPHEFIDSEKTYQSLAEATPERNNVFFVGDACYIFYDEEVYPFEFDDDSKESGVAKVPIFGSIDYSGDILKSSK